MVAIPTTKLFEQAGTSLKKVNLSHNKLVVIPDIIFEQCTMIESFIISHNMLGALPRSISQLTKLTELDLSNNRFADDFGLGSVAEANQVFPRSLKVLLL